MRGQMDNASVITGCALDSVRILSYMRNTLFFRSTAR